MTGGLGFIGSNFILYVLNNFPDYSIVNIDDQLSGSNLKSLHEIENSEHYRFVKGNITNKDLMEQLIDQCDAMTLLWVIANLLTEKAKTGTISTNK